ncbi:MAG: hypothetical protein RIQ52_715 [Pseudomonadota bacterium]|jgi:cytochrome d ubiquinol oxidase subunit II
MFDYETIRFIWWVAIGVVAVAFSITEGFDFGVCALLRILGRTDDERRVIINAVGGTWEGNQVWLVLLGGAVFAIWPPVYATLFSGLYAAMMLVLFALFLRPTGFDYRSKLDNPVWRDAWDWALSIGGGLPPILLGVLVGNLLLGLPFHLEDDLRPVYEGSFWGLLSPFALLCGVIGLVLMILHGALFLQLRTESYMHARTRQVVRITGPLLLVLLVVASLWLLQMDRPEITQMAGTGAPSNPLHKTVIAKGISWMDHFMSYPWMLTAPSLAMTGFMAAWWMGQRGKAVSGFIASSVGIAGLLFTIGFGLFPFLLISSTQPGSSLTLWDASSSRFTLLLSFWITAIFLPIVLAYTQWVYRVLWGKITPESIRANDHQLY